MLVLVSDMERLYRKTYHKNYLVVAVVYFMFVIFCFLLGFSYIIPRDGRPVIDYGNILFVVPIEIFGKETVRSVINTGYLYVALSVAHIIICIKYIMSIVKMRNRELHGSKEEDSGACRCDGEPQWTEYKKKSRQDRETIADMDANQKLWPVTAIKSKKRNSDSIKSFVISRLMLPVLMPRSGILWMLTSSMTAARL